MNAVRSRDWGHGPTWQPGYIYCHVCHVWWPDAAHFASSPRCAAARGRRWTQPQRLAMIAEYEAGASYTTVAQRYGITRERARQIILKGRRAERR